MLSSLCCLEHCVQTVTLCCLCCLEHCVETVMLCSLCCLERCVETVTLRSLFPRSGELRTQKLKSHLVRTELKRSPFQAWSRSVYSHTCYAYCQGFLPCLFLPFRSIHLRFFPKSLPNFFLCWLWLNTCSCVGLQNKIGHPAGCRFPCSVPRNINRLKKHDLWYDEL